MSTNAPHFFIIMMFILLPLSAFATGSPYQEHEDFIAKLGNNVIQILLNKHEDISVRKVRFRQEIKKHFALNTIGRFIMARYWRRMTPDQQTLYIKLFEDAVIENYASQFNNYNNQKLIIKSSRGTEDKGVVIKSEIRRPGSNDPLHIKWKVFNTKRGLKVTDVIVNNVSMTITLRNEYASAIQSRGGIEGLLDYLREKIKSDQSKQ